MAVKRARRSNERRRVSKVNIVPFNLSFFCKVLDRKQINY